ncbi:MATE family efflux transporter [Cerasicoccus frondis]|uniref:MATE family efflux transporter n=1 Tax=Cerasicoccus frondis TaxID=490090 RepID=UPI002852AFD7|nr:MATE family efflux transporter [Cerasicoccus frondis]
MTQFQRKNLFQLTLPLFIIGVFTVGVMLVDTLILAAYSDELAAAVSVANQILSLAYDFSGLLAIGAAILIAQYLGKDDIQSARRISVIAICANTILSFFIALVLMIGAPTFIDWVNTPPEVAQDARSYMNVIAVAMIMNGFIAAGYAVLRAFGHTWEIMVASMFGSIPYLLLECVLIFGLWGVPELGVYGSALATLIIRIVTVAFLYYVMRRHLKFSWSFNAFSRDVWKHIWKLTRISLPSVTDNLLHNSYQLTILKFISAFGVAAVLTRSYVLTLTAFASMVAYIISQGNEVLVGYDKGGDDNESARRRATRVALGTGTFTVALSLLFYVFSDVLIGMFTQNPEVLAEAKQVFQVNILLQFVMTANLILFNSLKAVGDVYWPVAYSLSITFLFALPLGWLLISHYEMGVVGMWIAMTAEEALKASVMYVRWRRMSWTRYNITESPVTIA